MRAQRVAGDGAMLWEEQEVLPMLDAASPRTDAPPVGYTGIYLADGRGILFLSF